MQTIFLDLFGGWGFFIIPVFVGIFTSFFIEAIKTYIPIRNRYITLILTLLISVLVGQVFNSYYETIPEYVLLFIMNLSFATLFYKLVGEKIVKKIIEKIGIKVEKEIDDVKFKKEEKK